MHFEQILLPVDISLLYTNIPQNKAMFHQNSSLIISLHEEFVRVNLFKITTHQIKFCVVRLTFCHVWLTYQTKYQNKRFV